MNKMRFLALSLAILLAFTACTSNTSVANSSSSNEKMVITQENLDSYIVANMTESGESELYGGLEFDDLNDEDLLKYIEDDVYNKIVEELDSDEYFVQEIKATYISQEYIDELEYNSKSNVYFGFSLKDLDQAFQGTRYVFSLGDNGETIVTEFEEYDDTYEKALKNVAVGTGVILICVVIAFVSDGTAVPAMSAIFATAAKTGTVAALSTGMISGITGGIVEGIRTGDMKSAFKAGVLEGSEGFKWAAFTGALTGGASETISLYNATINGLTMNEVAMIQKESKYPLDVIKQIHSMDEYNVFKNANLKTEMINGKNALIRSDIDLTLVDSEGRTNLDRMAKGLAPIDKNGKSFELHHIGQEANGTLAILSTEEHDAAVLHGYKIVSEIDRNAFKKTREKFWKSLAQMYKDKIIQ